MSGPTVARALREHFESVRLGELRRLDKKLRGLTDDDRQSIEVITAHVVEALVGLPAGVLAADTSPATFEALTRLFALGRTEPRATSLEPRAPSLEPRAKPPDASDQPPATGHRVIPMPFPHVAIIGGGISALTAAYELTTRGVPFVLSERAARCGSLVVTEPVGGYTIDAGPDALLTQKPAAIDLCRELGLYSRLCDQAARDTYVVRGGRLRCLPQASVLGIPTRWMPFVTTGAFSWRGKLRMAGDVLLPARPDCGDESIAAFIGRRFGREAVDYLAEPLFAGIHGGDPKRLSMRAVFPRFLELERQYRSVIIGLRKIARPAQTRTGRFVALPSGMSELTDALSAALPPSAIRTGIGVEGVDGRRGGYILRLSTGQRLTVPSVVIATPPAATRRIVESLDERLAASCRRLTSTSAVTVALGYMRSAVRHPLSGAGFVVPAREHLSVRAVSWVSCKWAGRAPADRVLLRAYLGGAAGPFAPDRPDATLIDTTVREITGLLDVVGDPELARVYRWRDATSQLEVGHLDVMHDIEHWLAVNPGLFLTASGFRGTGIADCVADARWQARCAAEQAQNLRRASAISSRTRGAPA